MFRMKRVFKFEERIPAVLIQCYEVIAETEEEALAMVQNGYGFHDSSTQPIGPGELELYDTEDLPEK
jgi:hypothetical protein